MPISTSVEKFNLKTRTVTGRTKEFLAISINIILANGRAFIPIYWKHHRDSFGPNHTGKKCKIFNFDIVAK